MGYETTAGLNVNNHYGQRFSGNSIGVEHSQDSIHEVCISFTGTSLNETFLPPVVIPKGALFLRYRLRVDEVFVVSGGGTVTFGGTVPGTNGVVLTEAELENLGTKTPASGGAGTWATSSSTGTTAAEKITKAISGTVTAGSGKATLIAEYLNAALV